MFCCATFPYVVLLCVGLVSKIFTFSEKIFLFYACQV